MESNGKSVMRDGAPSPRATGPGRLRRAGHQQPARLLPAAAPGHGNRAGRFPGRGRTDRRRRNASPALLFANCLAQSEAFLRGRSEAEVRDILTRRGTILRRRSTRSRRIKLFRATGRPRPSSIAGSIPAHARPDRRALRAQGLRPVGDLGHQSLRSMGRGAGQGIVQPARAAGRRRQRRSRRSRRFDRRPDFRAPGADGQLNGGGAPKPAKRHESGKDMTSKKKYWFLAKRYDWG